MSTEAEISAIADALDTLLAAIAEQPAPRTKPHLLSAADLAGATAAQEVAEEIVNDPIGRSLRLAIEALGMRLNEIGGAKAMHAALDDVVSRDPAQESWPADILDKRWDGIGSWLA